MDNLTFLDYEQIYGPNKLDIFKIYGIKCAITDFSILLGGYVSSDYHTSEGNSRENRTGWWWTKTPFHPNALVVRKDGLRTWDFVYKRTGGARPALPYSSISSISSNGVRGRNGILEVEYGEYPQDIVSEDFSRILEKAFTNMSYSNTGMKTTGKSYTTDSVRYQDTDTPFQARTHTEYEYNGKKYIRFVGDSNCSGKVLSDGRTIQNGDIYWIEVKPIKWMVDEKTNIAITKKIIFSGVQFNRIMNYTGGLNRTDIKYFMDKCFSKDIIPSFSKKINSEAKNQFKEIVDNQQNSINESMLKLENNELKKEVSQLIETNKAKDDEIKMLNLKIQNLKKELENLKYNIIRESKKEEQKSQHNQEKQIKETSFKQEKPEILRKELLIHFKNRLKRTDSKVSSYQGNMPIHKLVAKRNVLYAVLNLTEEETQENWENLLKCYQELIEQNPRIGLCVSLIKYTATFESELSYQYLNKMLDIYISSINCSVRLKNQLKSLIRGINQNSKLQNIIDNNYFYVDKIKEFDIDYYELRNNIKTNNKAKKKIKAKTE